MRGWFIGLVGACTVLGAGALASGCSDDESSGATSGTGNDASADGTTTGPGDATSGDGSLPQPTGVIEPAAAARAATFLASCISDDGVNRTLQELYLERTTNPFRSPAVIACLASKTNGCGAVKDCLGLTYSGDGGCASDGSCTGNVYEECSGIDFRLSVDCTPLGLQCKAVKGAYCGDPSSVACDESTHAGTCEGATPVGCSDGLTRRGLDCAKYGATCTTITTFTGGGTMTGCKGAGGACTGTSNDDTITARWEGIRCENGKLVGCMQGGLSTLDCATSAVSFTCFDAPDGGATSSAYCGTAAECTPKGPWDKVAATCDGTSIVMCNGGKIEKLDCTTLGFTGCNGGVCTPSML